MHDETLSVEEAATLAKVGIDCMKSLIDTGEIHAARFNRKHCVLLREDVIDYIRRRAREQSKQRRSVNTIPAAADRRGTGGRRRNPLPALAADAT